MADVDARFDDMLATIASQCADIKDLLKIFFSFLNRKTDFYVCYDNSNNNSNSYKMGFPNGIAEKILIESFRTFPMKKYSNVINNNNDSNTATTTNISKDKTAAISKSTNTITENKTRNNLNNSNAYNNNNNDDNNSTKSTTTTPKVLYNDAGKQIPIGNGGIGLHGEYCWTQTLDDLTIFIDSLPQQCRGKDISCTIKPKQLEVSFEDKILLKGELEEVIRVDESMWTLSKANNNNNNSSSNSQLVITLDKVKQTWWKHVIIGHPEIDTSKVDSSRNISDYDGETQAAIRKIMFEQQQKRLAQVAGNINDITAPPQPPT